MADTLIWPEIKALQTDAKHEITLIGEKIAERVSENNGLVDENLFQFGRHLNYLKLSKIGLIEISPKISNLNQLTQLAISDNLITTIPIELAQLTKLVYLDLSQNKINVIPSIFAGMSKLRTLLLRNNNITHLDNFKGLISLQELFLDHNNLHSIPEDIFELEELMVLSLSNNKFEDIPNKIALIKNLKTLNFEDNNVNDIPPVLGHMIKLKIIQLRNNPMKNVKTQLKKLINDNLYKAILDNLKKSSNAKQKRNRENTSESERDIEGNNNIDKAACVQIMAENLSCKVMVVNRSTIPKNQVIYFIIRNIEFSAEKLKLFIKFQEQLHKGECENRKLLTIGTHDLAQVRFPLKYSSKSSDSFKIQMMNLNSAYTGRELYQRLLKVADTERKSKKRGSPSGVHQYLYLTEIDSPQGVVEDAAGLVISFPPLTNCNATKISVETTDLLVELIGGRLDKCKQVAESLIGWMVENGLSAGGESLALQPMRVFEDNTESAEDGAEKFLVLFPNKNDLSNASFTVLRD